MVKIAPTIIEMSTPRRAIVAEPKRLTTSSTPRVKAAIPIFSSEPHSGALGLPPIIQRIATGKSEIPIMVIIEPVTISGKKRTIFEKKGVINIPKIELTMTAPKIVWIFPPVVPIAIMLATAANEVPCTIGSFAPNHFSPSVCSNVAKPPTRIDAVINKAISAAFRPIAVPTTKGAAIRPPYMVSTCCKPNVRFFPALKTSSSG